MSHNPSKEDVYAKSRLSVVQSALWLNQKLQPDVPQFNSSVCFYFRGPLNTEQFQQAYQAYIDRTDCMRLVVVEEDGIPQPKFLDRVEYTVPIYDYSQHDQPRAAARAWAQERAMRRFDLSQPMFEAAIMALGDDEWVYFSSQHHLIIDGWTFPLMMQRIADLYYAIEAGTVDEIGAYPSYKEYLDRQFAARANFTSDRIKELRRDRVKDNKEPLRFYGVSALEANNSVRRGELILSHEETKRIGEYCERPEFATKSRHATLFNMFATVYTACVRRVTGASRMTIGTMHHNRWTPEVQPVAGVFVGTMPIRVEPVAGDTFVSLHDRLRKEAMIARDRSREMQEAGLAETQFDVMINYQVVTDPPFVFTIEPGDWLFSGVGRETATLQVFFAKGWQTFLFYFDLNEGIFSPEMSDRFAKHFHTMLKAFLDDPNANLDEVEIVTDEERALLLEKINATARPFPDNTTAPALIDAQAEKTPNATAVYYEGRSITYRELAQRSNQLAHLLQELGVKTESLVGICLDRSIETVVAMLAVMKAGGAYLPLDPAYPRDRLEFMLNDGGAKFLITNSSLDRHVPHDCQHVLHMDTDSARIDAMPTTPVASQAGPASAAYVIYTSGSTGRPKGTVLEHRGLCNQFIAHAELLGLTESSRLLQFASICFDASVMEIFVTLGAGATLYLAPRNVLESPTLLTAFLREHRISAVTLAPTMLNMLNPGDLPDLATIVSAGERCPANVANRWSPGRRFMNGYGPTENTVCTTMHQCQGAYTQSPPIGTPVSNNEVYVLNESMRLMPVGTPGELHVGGVGLAREYLNRPELTAERFVRHPYSTNDAARLYKTGDLVRILPDGNLDFLGRIDSQVKVHGYRIELGEVESALESHPHVKAAAAQVHEIDGNLRLIGYVQLEPGADASPSDLRKYLLDRLPQFMAPSAIMVMQEFPQLPNGKVDRTQLPPPEEGHTEVDAVYTAPRTANERQLAAIWEKVFSRDHIGIHDNFYDLGGDSLTAIQIVEKARSAGMGLNPYDLFQHPTIEMLAEFIQPVESAPAENDGVEWPLMPSQQSILEAHADTPLTAYDLQFSSASDVDKVDGAIRSILSRHDALRFALHRDNGAWTQKVQPIPFETQVRWIDRGGRTMEALLIEETASATRAMRSPGGPVFMALGVKSPGTVHVRLLANDLFVDAPSWQIVLADMQLALAGDLNGTTGGHTFAANVRKTIDLIASPEVPQETPYWHDVLTQPVASLPRDPQSKPGDATHDVVHVEAEVPCVLQPGTANAFFETVFVSAVAKALCDWSESGACFLDLDRDLRHTGVPSQHVVGRFAYSHPCRIAAPGQRAPWDAYEFVREQLESIPSRGRHYGILRYVTRNNGFSSKDKPYPTPELRAAFRGMLPQSLAKPMFTAAQTDLPDRASPNNTYLIDVEGTVDNAVMRFTWSYRTDRFSKETVLRVARQAAQFAEAIVREREMAEEQRIVHDGGFVERPDQVSTFIPLRAGSDRTPFFCVSPAGGLVFPYFNLLPYLDPKQPFYGLQDPALNPGVKLSKTIPELAEQHVQTIRRIQPQGPYLLGGWSFGGFVAFEIAQRLTAAGEEVAFLGIIDQIVPGVLAKPSGVADFFKQVGTYTKLGARTFGLIVPYVRDGLYLKFSGISWRKERNADRFRLRDYVAWAWRDAMRQSVFWAADVKSLLGDHSKLQMWQQPTVRRSLLVFNANIQAIRSYKPGPYSGRIDLFRTEDFLADVKMVDPETFGWSAIAAGGVQVTSVPGNHVELMRKPYVEAIGKALSARLEQVQDQLASKPVLASR